MIFYINMVDFLHLEKNRMFVWYNVEKHSGGMRDDREEMEKSCNLFGSKGCGTRSECRMFTLELSAQTAGFCKKVKKILKCWGMTFGRSDRKYF